MKAFVRILLALIMTSKMGFSTSVTLPVNIPRLKEESYRKKFTEKLLLHLEQGIRLMRGKFLLARVKLNEIIDDSIEIFANLARSKEYDPPFDDITTIFNTITLISSRVSLRDGNNFVKLRDEYLVVRTNRIEEFILANKILKSNKKIKTLVLSRCNIDVPMADVFKGDEIKYWETVKGVYIRSCVLWPGVLDKLCEALCMIEDFSSFELSNSTPPDTLEPIINLAKETKLKKLVLRRLGLKDDIITPFAEFLKSNTHIVTLDMTENPIGDLGIGLLGVVLSENEVIRNVRLATERDFIGQEGTNDFFYALSKVGSFVLRRFDLVDRRIDMSFRLNPKPDNPMEETESKRQRIMSVDESKNQKESDDANEEDSVSFAGEWKTLPMLEIEEGEEETKELRACCMGIEETSTSNFEM